MKHLRQKLLAVAIAALPLAVCAAPQDGKVVAGNATIHQESATKIGITQTTDRAIIDWKGYSIGANEHVQYYQPSASSVSLNRVTGQDPSQILGRLTANGQVFLVNPNGIYFGKNAQIDVAGLIASTHNIRNEDFMAGRHKFDIPGKPGAAVINEGAIRIADTGIAAFVAPSVANRGVIAAKLGRVVLAAANGFTLDFTGDNLLSFMVNDEVAQTAFDLEGNRLTSFVENSGKIEAQGGYVLLTAKAAENAIHGVINHSGVIEAQTAAQKNGEIILHAGKGSLEVSGTLDASAPNGGDGGFIETSGGKVGVGETARITTAAPFGKTGTWLIDPNDYTIAASGGDITGAVLSSNLVNNNVTILSSNGAQSGNGDIFVNDVINWGSSTALTLSAYRNITVNANVTATGNSAGLVLTPGTGGSGYFYMASITRNKKITLSGSNPTLTIAGHNYTVINSLAALQNMNLDLAGYYALGSDIDASATSSWNGGQGFAPIGDFANRFMGFLNGLGHSISNLEINRSTEDYVGLFGIALHGADVLWLSNLRLSGGNISGHNTVGSLAGGAVFGWINNAVSSATVTGNGVVGGLIGQQDVGRITDSYATGAVTGTASPFTYVGGLVGVNNGPISRSFSTGDVHGDQYVGGLVGYNASAASTISDSFASGDVYGKYRVGGLAGTNNTGVTIERSMAYGAVYDIGTIHDRIGGLVGRNTGNVIDSYWDISKYATSQGGTGLSTAAMKQQSSFSGWDFASVWRIDAGSSYPYLVWTVVAATSSAQSSTGTPNSTRTDVCQVSPQVCVTRYEDESGAGSNLPWVPGVDNGFNMTGVEAASIRSIQLLPDFSSAIGPEGLDANRLSDHQISLLGEKLIELGVVGDRYQNSLLDSKTRSKITLNNLKYDPLIEEAMSEFDANLKLGKLKFATDSVVNTISLAIDVVTVGGGSALTASLRAPGKIDKFLDLINASANASTRLVGRPTKLNNLLHIDNNGYTEMIGALGSPNWKALMILAQNGAGALSHDQIVQLNSDDALKGVLQDFGVFGADLASANSTILNNALAKFITKTVIVIGAAAMDSDDSSLKEISKDIMRYGAEFIPVVGSVAAQMNSYSDQKSELSKKDQNTYDKITQLISEKKVEERKIFMDAQRLKLQKLFDQANSGGAT